MDAYVVISLQSKEGIDDGDVFVGYGPVADAFLKGDSIREEEVNNRCYCIDSEEDSS